MRKKLSGKLPLICILLGAVLILCAVSLAVYTEISGDRAQENTARILERAQALLPETVDHVPQERGNNSMASMEIDGVNVAGILEVPHYGRVLPLGAIWDTGLVASMPCRFTGSIYDGSLIIGAVGEQGQMEFAAQLEVGAEIRLTDMEGGRYTYRVAAIHHAQHATLEKLQSGDFPLTIFVKNPENAEYLLIRCETKS